VTHPRGSHGCSCQAESAAPSSRHSATSTGRERKERAEGGRWRRRRPGSRDLAEAKRNESDEPTTGEETGFLSQCEETGFVAQCKDTPKPAHNSCGRVLPKGWVGYPMLHSPGLAPQDWAQNPTESGASRPKVYPVTFSECNVVESERRRFKGSGHLRFTLRRHGGRGRHQGRSGGPWEHPSKATANM
jgi:hypothetical protein